MNRILTALSRLAPAPLFRAGRFAATSFPRAFLVPLLMFLAVSAFLHMRSASAQDAAPVDLPLNTAELTLSATTVNSSTDAAVTSTPVKLRGNTGVAFFPSFTLAGAGSTNVVLRFQVSHNGSTWTTTEPFTYTMTANGTNPVRAFTSFAPKDGLHNVKYLRLSSVNNQNANNLTNLIVRYAVFPVQP